MTYPYSQNIYPMMQYPTYPQQSVFYPPAVQTQNTQLVPQQTVQQPVAQTALTSPVSTNITWVENEDAATKYPVAIGTTVMLITYDERTAFKKSTDSTGKPLPMEIFDMIPRKERKEESPSTNYITKEEFDSRMALIEKQITDIADNEAEEMVVVPVKKRGRKSSIIVDANAEVVPNESTATI